MSDLEQNVLTFVEITGADPDLARVFIKNNDWELEPAVEEYMNNPGRYMVESHAAESDASVRQPLAPIVSRLADDEYEPSTRTKRGKRKRVEQDAQQQRLPESIFDAVRDLKSEELYFRHLQSFDNPKHIKHQQRLADLYRPPHAIITPGNFEEVNQIARAKNKWLLINVHHVAQFDCLRINRDVWSKEPIQQLVRDYFVLWYVYTNTATAKPYTSYYSADDWPHVAVLDPYTGERLAMWEGHKYGATSTALDEALNAFVAKHIAELSQRTAHLSDAKTGAASEAKNSAANQRTDTAHTNDGSERAVKRRRLADDEEERMMNMAIMASMAEEQGHAETREDKGREHGVALSRDMRDTGGNHSNTNNNNNNTSSNNNNDSCDTDDESVAELKMAPRNTTVATNHSARTLSGGGTTSSHTPTTTTTPTTTATPITSVPSVSPLASSAHSVAGPALQLQLRLPSARTEPLSYSADTPLHVLLADTRVLLQLPESAAVSLSSNYPRRTFTASQGEQSLRALGIENKSVLFVDVSE